MADIAKDAKISPDKPAVIGVSRLSGFLWREVWKHAKATLDGDAEALHDMRVAIRRLRSLLQNFEGQKNEPILSKSLRSELRDHRGEPGKLGAALGFVRDHDVLDEYLKTYAREQLKVALQSAPAEYSGLVVFEKFLQKERDKAFAPMCKRIRKAQRPHDLQENFARWSAGLSAAFAPENSLREIALKILPVRIEEILSHASTLDDETDEIGHHELRRALRRLRYTLETLGPCFDSSPEEIKARIKSLVALQDLLGGMQDRSVLHSKVIECFGDASTLPLDVAAFLEFGENRKHELLEKVRAAWLKMEQQENHPLVLK